MLDKDLDTYSQDETRAEKKERLDVFWKGVHARRRGRPMNDFPEGYYGHIWRRGWEAGATEGEVK